MLKLNISFSDDFPDETPSENKSASELALLILMNAAGETNHIKGYSRSEIDTCARQLLSKGYLRGTIINRNECVWSRPTRKGRMLIEQLKEEKD